MPRVSEAPLPHIFFLLFWFFRVFFFVFFLYGNDRERWNVSATRPRLCGTGETGEPVPAKKERASVAACETNGRGLRDFEGEKESGGGEAQREGGGGRDGRFESREMEEARAGEKT